MLVRLILFTLMPFADYVHSLQMNPLHKRALLFPYGYNALEPPPHTENGTRRPTVSVQIEILDTPIFDERTEEISLRMFVNMEWTDMRLQTATASATEEMFSIATGIHEEVWLPDVYLGVQNVYLLKPPITATKYLDGLWVHGNGVVNYVARLNPVIDCKMDFRQYPSDLQVCSFDFVGDKYDKRIDMTWDNESAVIYWGGDSTQNHRVGFKRSICKQSKCGDRDIQVNMTFYFQRKVGFHVLQTYLPSGLIVFVTWLGLFMPTDLASERLTLATTTLLTLTALFGSVRMTSPSVNYVKALDVWMAACLVAIFLVMVESIVILNLSNGLIGRIVIKKAKDQLKSFRHSRGDIISLRYANTSEVDNKVVESSGKAAPVVIEVNDCLTNIDGNLVDFNGDLDTKEPVVLMRAAKVLDRICRVVLFLICVVFTVGYFVWLRSGERMPPELVTW